MSIDNQDINYKDIKDNIVKTTDKFFDFRQKNLRNLKLQIFFYFIDFVMVVSGMILMIKGHYLYGIILFIAGFPELEKWVKLFKWIKGLYQIYKMYRIMKH